MVFYFIGLVIFIQIIIYLFWSWVEKATLKKHPELNVKAIRFSIIRLNIYCLLLNIATTVYLITYF